MKFITVQHYNSVVESILKEKEKQAELLHQAFTGITAGELQKELDNHFGGMWTIKKEESVKFSKADINAVAGARFFKGTGRSLLMGLAIIILLLSIGVKYIPDATALHYNIYYALCGVIALVFIYIYSHKQAKVRKELWHKLGRHEIEGK